MNKYNVGGSGSGSSRQLLSASDILHHHHQIMVRGNAIPRINNNFSTNNISASSSKHSNQQDNYDNNEEECPDLIIKPKKIPNPCKESITRQNLHRELLFNQKTGRQVLNQKSELQRALEKQRYKKASEEDEPEDVFKQMLEHRAKKIEQEHNKRIISEINEINGEYDKSIISSSTRQQTCDPQQPLHDKNKKSPCANANPEAEFLQIHARIHHRQIIPDK